MPMASSRPNMSGARMATTVPMTAKVMSSAITMSDPARPVSSPTMEKMKSV